MKELQWPNFNTDRRTPTRTSLSLNSNWRTTWKNPFQRISLQWLLEYSKNGTPQSRHWNIIKHCKTQSLSRKGFSLLSVLLIFPPPATSISYAFIPLYYITHNIFPDGMTHEKIHVEINYKFYLHIMEWRGNRRRPTISSSNSQHEAIKRITMAKFQKINHIPTPTSEH